jgi:hypothetical protein
LAGNRIPKEDSFFGIIGVFFDPRSRFRGNKRKGPLNDLRLLGLQRFGGGLRLQFKLPPPGTPKLLSPALNRLALSAIIIQFALTSHVLNWLEKMNTQSAANITLTKG